MKTNDEMNLTEHQLRVVLKGGAVAPTRAHPFDGGLDLYTPIKVEIPPTSYLPYISLAEVGNAIIDTGVCVEIPEGFVGFVKSKSGLNVKHGLTAEGVIDAHYTGSIVVKLYNHTNRPYTFEAGDKIAQLVILPCALANVEIVDSLNDTDRGTGGFGSTGR